ncbi:MAG: Uma2 family endonuclease, partial [Cyanobacteria bacterium P01_H01_bin.121]
PDTFDFWGLVRSNAQDIPGHIMPLNLPWTSPTLGFRFEMFEDGLAIFHPDGERFKDQLEVYRERDQAQLERDRAWAKLRELGIDPEQL